MVCGNVAEILVIQETEEKGRRQLNLMKHHVVQPANILTRCTVIQDAKK